MENICVESAQLDMAKASRVIVTNLAMDKGQRRLPYPRRTSASFRG